MGREEKVRKKKISTESDLNARLRTLQILTLPLSYQCLLGKVTPNLLLNELVIGVTRIQSRTQIKFIDNFTVQAETCTKCHHPN